MLTLLVLAWVLIQLQTGCSTQVSTEGQPSLEELREIVSVDPVSPAERCRFLVLAIEYETRELAELRQNLEDGLIVYTERHPQIVSTRNEIADRESRIAQRNEELAECDSVVFGVK